jgi:hypothetical protein
MKLEYELIEDAYDDTTHIRSMTEQARVPSAGWLIRTTLYSPSNLTVSVVFIPGDASAPLFENVGA